MERVAQKRTAAGLLAASPAARQLARDAANALPEAELQEVVSHARDILASASRPLTFCRVAAMALVRAFWLLLLVAAGCWMGHASMRLLAWPAGVVAGGLLAVMLIGWGADMRRRTLEARLHEADGTPLGTAISLGGN